MSKRKNPVNPDNIGALFLRDGEDIPYRLTYCDITPMATMHIVSEITGFVDITRSTLDFADFHLIRPPVLPPKSPRADKGGTYANPKKKEELSAPAIATENSVKLSEDAGWFKLQGHGGQRICPTHHLVLKSYPDGLWQCPQLGCDYVVRGRRKND